MAAKEEQFIEVLGVLAEGVRYKILSLIASKGEMTAKDILAEFDFTQPTLSHHMACLVEARLVNVERKGRFAYYSVNTFQGVSDIDYRKHVHSECNQCKML